MREDERPEVDLEVVVMTLCPEADMIGRRGSVAFAGDALGGCTGSCLGMLTGVDPQWHKEYLRRSSRGREEVFDTDESFFVISSHQAVVHSVKRRQ